jgi:hypothetical protein
VAFARPAGGSLVDALLGPSCSAPQAEEPQGEAVAFTAAGDAYVTVSEGVQPPVHRVAIEPVAPTTTSTTSAPGPTEPSTEVATDGTPLVLAAVAVAVLGGGALWWWRRVSRRGAR